MNTDSIGSVSIFCFVRFLYLAANRSEFVPYFRLYCISQNVVICLIADNFLPTFTKMPQQLIFQIAVIFLLDTKWMACTSFKLGHASIKFRSHFVVFNFKNVSVQWNSGFGEYRHDRHHIHIWLNSVGIQ